MRRILVGLPDSGIDPLFGDRIICAQGFELDRSGSIRIRPAGHDISGHGTILAHIITAAASRAALLNAQVFDATGPAAPAVVAAGIEWLVEQGADIVNMSFGLRGDRKGLRDACSSALKAGVLLVAAMPARGEPVYPAAYPGVIRVSGDARCAAGEFSCLDGGRVDFGASTGSIGHAPHQPGAGSSLAVAHVTGKLAEYLYGGGQPRQAVTYLRGQCVYFGREKRS